MFVPLLRISTRIDSIRKEKFSRVLYYYYYNCALFPDKRKDFPKLGEGGREEISVFSCLEIYFQRDEYQKIKRVTADETEVAFLSSSHTHTHTPIALLFFSMSFGSFRPRDCHVIKDEVSSFFFPVYFANRWRSKQLEIVCEQIKAELLSLAFAAGRIYVCFIQERRGDSLNENVLNA